MTEFSIITSDLKRFESLIKDCYDVRDQFLNYNDIKMA